LPEVTSWSWTHDGYIHYGH